MVQLVLKQPLFRYRSRPLTLEDIPSGEQNLFQIYCINIIQNHSVSDNARRDSRVFTNRNLDQRFNCRCSRLDDTLIRNGVPSKAK